MGMLTNREWCIKDKVIAFAKSLDARSDEAQVVYKRGDRANYNITHISKIEAQRLQCHVYGIEFEVVWKGVSRHGQAAR